MGPFTIWNIFLPPAFNLPRSWIKSYVDTLKYRQDDQEADDKDVNDDVFTMGRTKIKRVTEDNMNEG